MADTSKQEATTASGASIYSVPLLLRWFYDLWVLNISNTFFWRCSTSKILLPFFQKNVRDHHLDIGVGTGYYLANVEFPSKSTITLCDLNADSLAEAQKRIGRERTRCIVHDIEKPLPQDEKYFGSISLMYLLHCMPGPPVRKAAIFGHLRERLNKDGVLFGATILGKGVEHNLGGRTLMNAYNKKGIFGNVEDSADVFLDALKKNFEDVDARMEGTVLLFTAKKPKRGQSKL